MTRATARWPWKVAELGERYGWCWSDLASWAVDRTYPHRRGEDTIGLLGTARKSTCRADDDTVRTGRCYCGIVGPVDHDAEQRRDGSAVPLVTLLVLAFACAVCVLLLFVVAGMLGAADAAATPVGTGCVAPPQQEPPTGPGAQLVARQIIDARGGTP
jgi:hypothetical protein